jgi:hypothetical protein
MSLLTCGNAVFDSFATGEEKKVVDTFTVGADEW